MKHLRTGPDGLVAYTYDPQGNLVQESGTGVSYYSYDPFNRQSKVVKPDKRLQENRYDPEGLRAEMVENGRITRFVFHQKELVSELDERDQLVSFYQRGHGVDGLLQDQEHAYVLKDERQSTIFILDQDQEIKNQYRYDAFGVDAGKTEVIANRILYTGQQYDDVAEQYYLRARYYNPVIGRFLREDVYRGDGLNLYAYCGNNPVMYYDPSGYAKDPGKYGMGGAHGVDKPGWINHNIYNKVRNKFGRRGIQKFISSMKKGLVQGKNNNGVKYLAGGIDAGGTTYYYEIKVKGDFGDSRIYGNYDKNSGHIVFDYFGPGDH